MCFKKRHTTSNPITIYKFIIRNKFPTMDRREAIKRAAIMVGGSILMPDILKAWNAPTVIENPFFKITAAQEALIAEIAETIIPTTSTPGAKAVFGCAIGIKSGEIVHEVV